MESAVTETKVFKTRAVGAATLAEAFRITAVDRRDDVAIRTKGDAFSITWGELRERVDALAGGLSKLGVKRGDTIALMLSNRPEFHLCDLAAMMLGATPFSIYSTYSPPQIQHLVSDADARVLICEQQFLPQVLEAREGLGALEHVIVVDGEPPQGTLALADVEGSNPGFDVEASLAQIKPDDVLTLIYTSGTTGPPKGVQLTHRNLLTAVEALEILVDMPRDGRVISWLPSAHIAERNAHHYFPIVYGLEITCCDDPRQVLSYLPEVRPSWFFAVPRIWEKLKAGLETMAAALPDEQSEAMALRARGRDRKGPPGAARRGRCRPRWPSRWRRPTRRSSRGCVRRWDSTRWRRSTSARRRRRSRCWSSSTRSACRSPSSGA